MQLQEGDNIPHITKTNTQKTGIGVWRAAFILVTQVAGTGILALPTAASLLGGWTGVGLLALLCVNAGYVNMYLGRCWILLEQHIPELKGIVRNPYPVIGEKAFGLWAKKTIAVLMQVSLLGSGIVYLLLMSEILARHLTSDLVPFMTQCTWLLVVSAVLCPAMWLGSPRHFWGLGLLGLVTTLVTAIIAIVMSLLHLSSVSTLPDTSVHLTWKNFFLGLGMAMFSYAGAGCFPSVQNDMTKRERFPLAVLIAFTAIILLYVPLAGTAFAAYGQGIASNLFASLNYGPAVVLAECLVLCNLFTVFVITTNPAMQFLENALNVDKGFGRGRCTVRTGSLLVMLLVAASLREFGKLLALVGGSSVVLLNLIFPVILYLRLCAKFEPQRSLQLWRRIYLYSVLVLAAIGGVAATTSAVMNIYSSGSNYTSCFM